MESMRTTPVVNTEPLENQSMVNQQAINSNEQTETNRSDKELERQRRIFLDKLIEIQRKHYKRSK